MSQRPLRFLVKKRGDRRTGSQQAATLGEAVVYGIMLAAGLIVLMYLVNLVIWPEWRANHHFVEGRAVVIGKALAENRETDTVTFRPDIEIEHLSDGVKHRAVTHDITRIHSSNRSDHEAALEQFTVGEEYPCWYNPADPSEAVLVRGYTWWMWLFLFLPAVLLYIGGWGLIASAFQWGATMERRTASLQQARLLVTGNLTVNGELYPAIPSDDNITNSPGTHLPFRLPINVSTWWKLFGICAITLIWNGIALVFAVRVIIGYFTGAADFWLALFLIPFVIFGVLLTFAFVHELLIAIGVGPTQLEISAHPLAPGEEVRVWISQGGRLTLNRLAARLVCEETATYRQGTDTRTETRVVFERLLWERRDAQILDGAPLETEFACEIPTGSMHSYKGQHNEIHWRIIITGNIPRRPNFERSFPVIVYPGALTKLI